jgi:hypothetical protein
MGGPSRPSLNSTRSSSRNLTSASKNAETKRRGGSGFHRARADLGKCPQCGSGSMTSGMNYICEKAARRDGCTFRVGKIILQRAIEKEQVQKLLTQGRTDLLEKFISKKGRPFKAFLVLGPDGKVIFEFEPRTKKGGPGQPNQRSPRRNWICPKPSRWPFAQSAKARFWMPASNTFARNRRRTKSRANSR